MITHFFSTTFRVEHRTQERRTHHRRSDDGNTTNPPRVSSCKTKNLSQTKNQTINELNHLQLPRMAEVESLGATVLFDGTMNVIERARASGKCPPSLFRDEPKEGSFEAAVAKVLDANGTSVVRFSHGYP